MSVHKNRIEGIDALRGVAVVLMVSQHLIAWLWNAPDLTTEDLARDHFILLGLNGLGYLSAPLFIVLAGAGATLFMDQHASKGSGPVLFQRGIYVFALGYLLNFVVPGWFSPGSWYVLHLIGLCLMAAPALVKLKISQLAVLATGVLVVGIAAQSLLRTPWQLDNARMTDAGSLAAMLKLAVAEGHFPVLPWSALFLAGMGAARMVLSGNRRSLFVAAAAITAFGVGLSLAPLILPQIRNDLLLTRITAFSTYTFPLYPSAACILMGLGMGATGLVMIPTERRIGLIEVALIDLGRVSLTVFLLHIFLFREVLARLDGANRLSALETGFAISGVLLALAGLAFLWSGHGFRYGAEWLMRKVTPATQQ